MLLAKNAAIAAEKKEREGKEKAEKQAKAKEEADRLASEKAALKEKAAKEKKKPVRYPTEDLDVTLSDKEKKAGVKVKRPVPSRVSLPFNEKPGVFEPFLMSWNFLAVYGYVLLLTLPRCSR